jgi:hypothetical protein
VEKKRLFVAERYELETDRWSAPTVFHDAPAAFEFVRQGQELREASRRDVAAFLEVPPTRWTVITLCSTKYGYIGSVMLAEEG